MNSVPGVEFKRESHGEYALNDIVVELSHFLDNDVLRNVEFTCLENTLRSEWELNDDFKLVDTVNKEAVLVSQELEEKTWREAGKFTENDISSLKEVISVKRLDQGKFEEAFYDLDMQSLDRFIKDIDQ